MSPAIDSRDKSHFRAARYLCPWAEAGGHTHCAMPMRLQPKYSAPNSPTEEREKWLEADGCARQWPPAARGISVTRQCACSSRRLSQPVDRNLPTKSAPFSAKLTTATGPLPKQPQQSSESEAASVAPFKWSLSGFGSKSTGCRLLFLAAIGNARVEFQTNSHKETTVADYLVSFCFPLKLIHTHTRARPEYWTSERASCSAVGTGVGAAKHPRQLMPLRLVVAEPRRTIANRQTFAPAALFRNLRHLRFIFSLGSWVELLSVAGPPTQLSPKNELGRVFIFGLRPHRQQLAVNTTHSLTCLRWRRLSALHRKAINEYYRCQQLT